MLDSLREDVCAIAKRSQAEGLCANKAGNFSVLDPDSWLVVITPSGVDRETLTPRDLVIIDLYANVVENFSNLKPSSEALMHLAIYATRPDTRAVVHTHSLYGTTFALMNRPIPALVYEAASMGLTQARIPVAPYARPGTLELAANVVDACKEAECFLLEKHGAVTFDTVSIAEAYRKAVYLEEMAHLYYNALTLGQGAEPPCISQDELSAWKYPDHIKLGG